jgi:signal transduction histidine kinase
MLKQSSSNPDLKEKYLNLIKEGLERIESTVNKLLWMSRKDEHKPVNLNLKYSINEIYSFIDYRIKKNMIKFLAEIEDNLVMLVDPHDFQQMMLNIFINSIQSMPRGGNLIVKGYKENSKIMLEIIDTGEGITGENIDKIFDPFFTTKPPGEGTGLGLWMTYEIIKNYNGEISVESEVGKGSRFILSFPLSG